MNQPIVSIVIPVYNGAKTIGQTIEACLNQDYQGLTPLIKGVRGLCVFPLIRSDSLPMLHRGINSVPSQAGKGDRGLLLEIIVVDDGSTDNTAEVVKKYYMECSDRITAGINIVNALQKKGEATAESRPRRGPAAARNLGWQNARGEIIFFTDADCIPPPDWVSNLISGFSNSTFRIPHSSLSMGAAGGGYDIANPNSLLAVCIQSEMDYRYNRMPEQTKFLSTHNLAVRREVLEQIGGFNQSFQNSSAEDNDLVYRIRKAGYSLMLQKETRMIHYHPVNLWKYLRKQFQHAFWRIKLYLRHPDMVKGDDYTSLKDAVEPFLALFILTMLPFVFLPILTDYRLLITDYSFFSMASSSLLAAFFLSGFWQLLWAVRIIYKNSLGGDKPRRYILVRRVLFLSVLGFLRSFARGLGMAAGIFNFFIVTPLIKIINSNFKSVDTALQVKSYKGCSAKAGLQILD